MNVVTNASRGCQLSIFVLLSSDDYKFRDRTRGISISNRQKKAAQAPVFAAAVFHNILSAARLLTVLISRYKSQRRYYCRVIVESNTVGLLSSSPVHTPPDRKSIALRVLKCRCDRTQAPIFIVTGRPRDYLKIVNFALCNSWTKLQLSPRLMPLICGSG